MLSSLIEMTAQYSRRPRSLACPISAREPGRSKPTQLARHRAYAFGAGVDSNDNQRAFKANVAKHVIIERAQVPKGLALTSSFQQRSKKRLKNAEG
jgi:hypothetical protein